MSVELQTGTCCTLWLENTNGSFFMGTTMVLGSRLRVKIILSVSCASAEAISCSIGESIHGCVGGNNEDAGCDGTPCADRFLAHSMYITGRSMAISFIGRPSTSKTRTFPACVPMAISILESSQSLPASSVTSPPDGIDRSNLLSDDMSPLGSTDTHVAGARTCHVLKTFAPV